MLRKKILVLICLLLTSTALIADNVIDVGDTISIHVIDSTFSDLITGKVTEERGLSGGDPHGFMVSDSGEIYLPGIGAIGVEGKTAQQVKEIIKHEFYKKKYRNITVTILIQTMKYNYIYVLGEIMSPGLYKIPKHNYFLNKIANLINLSGGFTELADIKNISVISEENKEITVNMFDLIDKKDLSQNVVLHDKDTVVVNRKLVSKVYVLGAITKPGAYNYDNYSGYSEYVLEAGGFAKDADANNIGIIRKVNNKFELTSVKMDILREGSSTDAFVIKEGDIIYVPKYFFSGWKDILSTVGTVGGSVFLYDKLKTR
jgi:polysaccharide biosynthesis/export protein